MRACCARAPAPLLWAWVLLFLARAGQCGEAFQVGHGPSAAEAAHLSGRLPSRFVVHSFAQGARPQLLAAKELQRLLRQLGGSAVDLVHHDDLRDLQGRQHSTARSGAVDEIVDAALAGAGAGAGAGASGRSGGQHHVFVARVTHPVVAALARHAAAATAEADTQNNTLAHAIGNLEKDDAHLLHSVSARAILCCGKTAVSTLYAAYALAEELGAGFYLSGEVLPPPNADLHLPTGLKKTFIPRFNVRGLQPFHDFPMGVFFF